MKPILLPPNQPRRHYRGGEAIAEFRGVGPSGGDVPEDWVGSTTTFFGEHDRGLTRLDGGSLLRDAMAADPVSFLGADHERAFGPQPELLVKLLHAGQRLPVHVHPTRQWARRHLDCPWGKTEGWVVLGRPGVVYVGFVRNVDPEELARWVETQDVAAMLGVLHEVSVNEGDAVLVPAGLPHAIGEGVLVAELQEPTDLSVLLEWTGFDVDGERDGHLGIGFEQALTAVHRSGVVRAELERLIRARGEERALGPSRGLAFAAAADAFFRCERIAPPPDAPFDAGFSILVGTADAVELRLDTAEIEVRRGETWLIPYAAGEGIATGSGELLRCRPPDPWAATASTTREGSAPAWRPGR